MKENAAFNMKKTHAIIDATGAGCPNKLEKNKNKKLFTKLTVCIKILMMLVTLSRYGLILIMVIKNPKSIIKKIKLWALPEP